MGLEGETGKEERGKGIRPGEGRVDEWKQSEIKAWRDKRKETNPAA